MENATINYKWIRIDDRLLAQKNILKKMMPNTQKLFTDIGTPVFSGLLKKIVFFS